jgi:ribosomal protein L40E
MKLCSKCSRIVTDQTYCAEAECPSLDIVIEGLPPIVERKPQKSALQRESFAVFCGECGAGLRPGAEFCGKCGTPNLANVTEADLLPERGGEKISGEAVTASRTAVEKVDEVAVELTSDGLDDGQMNADAPSQAEMTQGASHEFLDSAKLAAYFCGECGAKLKALAVFCGRCGTSVEAFSPSSAMVAVTDNVQISELHSTEHVLPTVSEMERSDQPVSVELGEASENQSQATARANNETEIGLEPAFEMPQATAEADDWDYDAEPQPWWKRKAFLAGLVVTTLLAFGGYYLTLKRNPEAQRTPTAENAAALDAGSKMNPPMLLGAYRGHLADQDIEIRVGGAVPKALVSSSGTADYANVVNGGKCSASLVPVKGGGVGGSTSNAVDFLQEAVPDKPACPKDIPVRIDISDQPKGEDGVVQSIKVEWLNQNGSKVLMVGVLRRGGQ